MSLHSAPTARALAILDLLTAQPQQALGLTEITERINLNKATCHAILATMTAQGFLAQHPRTKTYRLGPCIIAAGHAALNQFPPLDYARGALAALEHDIESGFTVTGCDKKHVIALARYGPAEGLLSEHYQLGLRLPCIAPIGACFIAWAPRERFDAWLSAAHAGRGRRTETLDRRFRKSTAGIRRRGYEVTLKTQAEAVLREGIRRAMDDWKPGRVERVVRAFQRGLCEEATHMDRLDARAQYRVSAIAVPVFTGGRMPELCLNAGPFIRPVGGADIQRIAKRMLAAAKEVAARAMEA